MSKGHTNPIATHFPWTRMHCRPPYARHRPRPLGMESLEERRLMAGLPFGASPNDTGEFLLGRVVVTPVLLESDGSIDTSTEDWTASHVSSVMSKVQEGLQWWNDLLATKSSVHTLEWVVDRTYVDQQPTTPYEPIQRISNAYEFWVTTFLDDIGFATSFNLEQNIRSFNHAQRVKYDADWSFTIFVVNAEKERDGTFAPGGSFSRAFAFAGGLFMVVPSVRPASTFAHELGHIFWARDEYSGGGNYYDRRGYYDAQNTNAIDGNPDPNFQQSLSIMSAGSVLQQAYSQLMTPASTLAMIGWQDSDGDGIFDVLDVPLQLEGTGRYVPEIQKYVFEGRAAVQALPNRNSSGLQNDITLNRIGRVEYRIDQGDWILWSTPNVAALDLEIDIPILPEEIGGTLEIRAIDPRIGVASNLFSGRIDHVPDTTTRSGIQGFVWEDRDQDRIWDPVERELAGYTVQLVDAVGQPLALQQAVEPDQFPEGPLGAGVSGVRLDVVGYQANGSLGVFLDSDATTGSQIFKPYSLWSQRYVDSFHDDDLQLRARFDDPTSYASIDAVAFTDNAHVRLEAFDVDGALIDRAEVRGMLRGQRATLEVASGDRRIAKVIARGIQNSYVKLDHFRFGPAGAAVTNADGSYFLENLEPGTYRILVLPPYSDATTTNTSDGVMIAALDLGGVLSHVDVGVYIPPSPWRNSILAEDVDGDEGVSPLDVLALVNDLNRNGSRALTGSPAIQPPYYDVNGDRYVSPLDVLMVINWINRGGQGGGGEGESAAPEMVIDAAHGETQPRVRSFALERSRRPSTTWIVDRTIADPLPLQGPERCGCPACSSWEQVAGEEFQVPATSESLRAGMLLEEFGPARLADEVFASLAGG